MKLIISGMPAVFDNEELARGYLLRHSVTPGTPAAELRERIARWLVAGLGAGMIPRDHPDLHDIAGQVAASVGGEPPTLLEWSWGTSGEILYGRAGGLMLFRISREDPEGQSWQLTTTLPGRGYEGCHWPRMCEDGGEKLKEEAEGLLRRWSATVFEKDQL